MKTAKPESKLRWSVCFLLFIISTSVALCGPAGPAMPSQLTNDSDAVVVGTLLQFNRSELLATMNLRVDRIIKGSAIQVGDQIVMRWRAGHSMAMGNLPLAGSRLWFLKADPEQGGWSVLPVVAGDTTILDTYYPVTPNSPAALPPDASPFARVASELASTVEASDGRSRFSSDVLMIGDPALDKEIAPRLYASQSAAVKSIGLGMLVRSGNSSALIELANDPTSLAANIVAGTICDFRSTDPPAISALGSILAAKASATAIRCAAEALRGIHTAETLPYLAALMDSPVLEFRYYGVSGLAFFANDYVIQTTASPNSTNNRRSTIPTKYTPKGGSHFPPVFFRGGNERDYIEFWKAWWRQFPELHGAK
jgi:hypothetical protein